MSRGCFYAHWDQPLTPGSFVSWVCFFPAGAPAHPGCEQRVSSSRPVRQSALNATGFRSSQGPQDTNISHSKPPQAPDLLGSPEEGDGHKLPWIWAAQDSAKVLGKTAVVLANIN